jgi:hypothetical protein
VLRKSELCWSQFSQRSPYRVEGEPPCDIKGEARIYDKLDRESRAAWEEKGQRDDRVPIGHNTRNHLLTRSITPPNEAATL